MDSKFTYTPEYILGYMLTANYCYEVSCEFDEYRVNIIFASCVLLYVYCQQLLLPTRLVLYAPCASDFEFSSPPDTLIFYKNISRTSAVSSTNFWSILIFASCVVGTCNIPRRCVFL